MLYGQYVIFDKHSITWWPEETTEITSKQGNTPEIHRAIYQKELHVAILSKLSTISAVFLCCNIQYTTIVSL